MATIEGARVVGLGDEVGSLEAGKQADLWRWRLKNRRYRLDLTALNLSPVLETPVRNIVLNLVYAGSGHEVKTMMVAGKVRVRAAGRGRAEVLVADEAAVRSVPTFPSSARAPVAGSRPGASSRLGWQRAF